MPRISTDNYDTVASWNGSQDLFVVEQPDGTKVATPALLKQYVLDGVTETSEQYAESSTARNVTSKTVTLPGFELETGARISVRFTNTGTSNPASGNLTLNVNGTGAKEIVDSHTNKTKLTYTSGGLFYNNIVNDFIYDGTYWVYMNRDNNTTYTSKAAASGGTATSLCTTGEKYTWNNKQSALTFDNAPTQNSNNPVKSGGVYTALRAKQNTLTFDNVPTQNSNNPVKSGGIYSKIGDLSQTGLTGDSVAEQLGDVNNKVSIVSNISPGPNLTMLKGVYVKIGTLVSVNLACRATGAITPDSVVCSVPTNYMANAPLNIYINSQLASGSNCRIFNGSVRAGANVSSGTEFCIQGSYISTT